MERDGLPMERALERFAAQQPEAFYTGRADLVIDNGGGPIGPRIERVCAQLKGAGG